MPACSLPRPILHLPIAGYIDALSIVCIMVARENTIQWDSSMEEDYALSDEALMAAVSSVENQGMFRSSLVKAPKHKHSGKTIDLDVINEVQKRLLDIVKK